LVKEYNVLVKNNESHTCEDKGMIRVLVYGTLKKDHSNHGLLERADSKFIGYDSVTGPFRLWDMGAIPAAMDQRKETNKIRGELWATTPEGLASLDMLEGHPHLYRRRKLITDIHNRRAWMYFLMADRYWDKSSVHKQTGLWHPNKDEAKFWLHHTPE
jgi:gamma-glutamylcyclotransferase (GGCT)/AIG2-like uncharacterized protein YtfP